MRESFTQLYVHFVWATWDRLPLLTPEIRETAYRAIHAKCRELRTEVVEIGGTEDHVHLLVRMPATIAVSDLAKHVKGSSSHLVTHGLAEPATLKWQGAYAAFSVSKSFVPVVSAYIRNQAEHHREHTTERDMEIAWVESQPVPGD